MSEPRRYVSPDGRLAGGAAAELPVASDELLAGYRAVRRARHFDERAVTLQRQGRLGVYAPFRGQEAAQVGTALALRSGDWLVPSYRETAAALTHGLPLATAILYWRAHPAGWEYPADLRLLPFYVPIASQLTHAVGLAHASTLTGDGAVTMVYVGDGGSSEGDFHEALNMAAVYRAPVVFVVQNNGWAISVPTARQMGNTRIADRAAGYGIPGTAVDGNDLLAVTLAAREAVDLARDGGGPTLIEAVTYRIAPHTTSDDPKRYRDEAVTAEREAEEPLVRLDALLVERGLWGDGEEGALRAALEREFASALAAADERPLPAPGAIVEHVFESLSAEQRWAWEALR